MRADRQTNKQTHTETVITILRTQTGNEALISNVSKFSLASVHCGPNCFLSTTLVVQAEQLVGYVFVCVSALLFFFREFHPGSHFTVI